MRLCAAFLISLLSGCAPVWCVTTRSDFLGSLELATTRCGHPRHWNYFPIIVQTCVDNPSTLRDVQDAVSTWNEAVGTTFLEVQEMEEPCAANHEYGTIAVGVGELGLLPNGNILLGTTNIVVSESTGMIESAVVLLDEDNDPATSLAVSIHELGHAFGLRHDENMPISIMYPLTWAPGLQQITAADSAAVRAQVPPFFEQHDE